RVLLIERGWSRRLKEVNAEDQCIFLRNRANRTCGYCIRYTRSGADTAALVPNLMVTSAKCVIAYDAIAVTPVDPASICILGEKLVRAHTLLALKFAELQHRLAGRQRVGAQVGVLKAVQKAGLLHPQIVADPGH